MIIDVIDMAADGKEDVADAKAAGNPDPILVYGMSNAIGYMVSEIIHRAGHHRNIGLLRIHGHGIPGVQGVGTGEGGRSTDGSVSTPRALTPPISADLARLKPYFALGARTVLLGCSVGSGKRGWQLLGTLSNLWGVPVTAGLDVQIAGDGSVDLRGATKTVYPR